MFIFGAKIQIIEKSAKQFPQKYLNFSAKNEHWNLYEKFYQFLVRKFKYLQNQLYKQHFFILHENSNETFFCDFKTLWLMVF